MADIKYNPRSAILIIFIVVIAAVRVLINMSSDMALLANFSPVGAMALFGGAYFNKQWKAFVFPLLMLFLSDFILQQTVFKNYGNGILYEGWYWVYGAFTLMTLAGRWLLRKATVKNFLLSVLVCVFIHWIVTDIGVWYGSKVFSQNLKGFIDCLIIAIPFELRFLTGTLVYGAIMFGLYFALTHSSKVVEGTAHKSRVK